jgi:hypothetical protein
MYYRDQIRYDKMRCDKMQEDMALYSLIFFTLFHDSLLKLFDRNLIPCIAVNHTVCSYPYPG